MKSPMDTRRFRRYCGALSLLAAMALLTGLVLAGTESQGGGARNPRTAIAMTTLTPAR